MTNCLAYSQAVMWQRYYDYNHQRNIASDVIQTYDGGYMIAGGLVVHLISIY